MRDFLKTIFYVIIIALVIFLLIWLFYGNGVNIIKAKTNKAITGESFDKNGENVRSWASNNEADCKRDCMWDTKQENPIYLWEETNRTERYDSYFERTYVTIEGSCYCKY